MKTLLTACFFVAVATSFAQVTSTVSIDAMQGKWTDAGITVAAGDQLKIEQSGGSWTCDKLHHGLVSADGHKDEVQTGLANYAQYKTLKSAFFACLLANVDGHVIPAGSLYDHPNFPYSGRLYLKINDEACTDNGGIITVNVTQKPGNDINRGLVAYYPFNAQATDESVNTNDGQCYGDPKIVFSDRLGDVKGKAMSFDGVDDYVRISNATGFNGPSMTIAYWIKPPSFLGVGNDAIIDKGFTSHTSPHYEIHMGITGDKYDSRYAGRFQFTLGAASYNTATYYWTPNTWYYVVMSYDKATQSFGIFINNKAIYQATTNANIIDYGKDVFIGRCGNVAYYTPFTIDEIRFYNRALNAAEREMLYKN